MGLTPLLPTDQYSTHPAPALKNLIARGNTRVFTLQKRGFRAVRRIPSLLLLRHPNTLTLHEA
jgi:hypothetical protein